MSKITVPKAPEGHRWRFVKFANCKELRLERKGRFFWKCVARSLISEYGTPQFAVDKAVRDCLGGRDWLDEAKASVARRQKIERERSEQFPKGVVE